MITITATEAKNHFGKYIEDAQKSPVIIEKQKRPSVVILSYEYFSLLQAREDEMWGMMADEALKTGFMGNEKTMAFLKDKIDEDIKT